MCWNAVLTHVIVCYGFQSGEAYNVLSPEDYRARGIPLPSHFVTRLFCIGHIKSVQSNDEGFVEKFKSSSKCLLPNYSH